MSERKKWHSPRHTEREGGSQLTSGEVDVVRDSGGARLLLLAVVHLLSRAILAVLLELLAVGAQVVLPLRGAMTTAEEASVERVRIQISQRRTAGALACDFFCLLKKIEKSIRPKLICKI
jgi:hypothetical protein